MTMNWRLCALLSAFFAALTAILGKVGVREVNSNLATGATGQLRQWSARSWLFVALSGMATGLSWLFYFHALKLESASKVAPVDKLSVPMTILLAVALLGEPLTWQTVLGGLLVVAGSLVLLL